jgi:hypothetical protein
VIEQLEKTYGITYSQMSFEKRIIEIAENITPDYYDSVLAELLYVKDDKGI